MKNSDWSHRKQNFVGSQVCFLSTIHPQKILRLSGKQNLLFSLGKDSIKNLLIISHTIRANLMFELDIQSGRVGNKWITCIG